jgi:hypothetical protein
MWIQLSVIVPPVADKILMTNATAYGLLGAALSAVNAERESPFCPLLISSGLFGLFPGLLSFSLSFKLSLMLFIATGLTGIMHVTSNLLLQPNAPEKLRG